jgi:signal transduction histidine kinase
MSSGLIAVDPPPWERAAESIAAKIRWIGVVVGYLAVNLAPAVPNRAILNAILGLGAVYALFDTWFSFRGRVFLGRYPLFISVMEAVFIGLLCYFHDGMSSSFRYFYFLSLICFAIRNSPQVTFGTCILHGISFSALFASLPEPQRDALGLVLNWIILGWFTWAASAFSLLLKRAGHRLRSLNSALREHQAELETRIAERTRDLQESQAHVLHQEKMAAFGLLAAGIAHEVGNPLTSISSIVQMLERHDLDEHTRDRLSLVSGQLQRIRGTLRELVEFSRPTTNDRSFIHIREVVDEALNIAKYYKDTKRRQITVDIPTDVPVLFAVRRHLVQVFLNLIFNAVDATTKVGRIAIFARHEGHFLTVSIRDDGVGVSESQSTQMFQPYFTTKKHGTGLGLFVTRQLLTELGGEVSFTSVLHSGTDFKLRLPLNLVNESKTGLNSELSPMPA